MLYGKEPRLPAERVQEVVQRPPTDGEVELLRERHLEHIPDLAHYRTEASARAERRMAHEAEKQEEAY